MTDDTIDRPARPNLARYLLLALIVPAVVVLTGVALMLVAMPQLPDPVGIHWNAAGQVDGFGPVWLSPVMLAVVGLGLPLLFAAMTIIPLRRGDYGYAYRFLAAINVALALFLTILVTWSTLAQVGLTDAKDAPSVGFPLLVGLAVAVVAGIAAWKLLPAAPFVPTHMDAADATDLRSDEHPTWVAKASFSRGALIAMIASVLLLVVLAVVNVVLSAPGWSTVVIVASALFVSIAIAATSVFHVRVDAEGLTVTSLLGYPRMRVPANEIVSVAAVQVNPVGEFGGWGLRWAPGRTGVVTRTGEGIEVHRTSGKSLTVTVDDAATGAALLEAYARRARG